MLADNSWDTALRSMAHQGATRFHELNAAVTGVGDRASKRPTRRWVNCTYRLQEILQTDTMYVLLVNRA